MSDENTKDLTQGEMLTLILAEVRALNTRVGALEERQAAFEERQASLEAKVDERLHDTRPLWREIHAQTERLAEQYTEMAKTLRLIEKQLNALNRDVLRMRAEHEIMEDRLDLLEQRPA